MILVLTEMILKNILAHRKKVLTLADAEGRDLAASPPVRGNPKGGG